MCRCTRHRRPRDQQTICAGRQEAFAASRSNRTRLGGCAANATVPLPHMYVSLSDWLHDMLLKKHGTLAFVQAE